MDTQSKEKYFLCNWFNYELTGQHSLSCYVLHTNNYFLRKNFVETLNYIRQNILHTLRLASFVRGLEL